MFARHIPLGNGDETGKPRLGGQHIVIARVEVALRHAVAEREQVAIRVIEKAKIHFTEQSVYLCSHVLKPSGESIRLLRTHGKRHRQCFPIVRCPRHFRQCVKFGQCLFVNIR